MPKYLFGDSICIPEDLVIPKSQNANLHLIETECPDAVASGMVVVSVLAAVEFHSQATRRAVEIKNIPSHAMLTAKFESFQVFQTQHTP
jgi:hypothetical protein